MKAVGTLAVIALVVLAGAAALALALAPEPAASGVSATAALDEAGALSPSALRTTAMGLVALLAFAVMLRYADEA